MRQSQSERKQTSRDNAFIAMQQAAAVEADRKPWHVIANIQTEYKAGGKTLNQVLSSINMSAQKSEFKGKRDIVDGFTGEIIFTGNANQTWNWLSDSGVV